MSEVSEQVETPTQGDSTAAVSAEDPTQNLKAEFSRKLNNLREANEAITAQANEIAAQQKVILQHLQTSQQPQTPAPSKEDLEDLKYSDPDKYIELKMGAMKDDVLGEVRAENQVVAERTVALNQLAQEFPELNDDSSDMYKKAVEIYQTLPKEFKDKAAGYKLAVHEAASQVGVLPQSKRANQEVAAMAGSKKSEDQLDEFIGSSGSTAGGKSAPKKSEKLDEKIVTTARLMGLDINDPKVVERLQQRTQRKRWNRWE